MNLRLLLNFSWFFVCILLSFSGTAQTCNGNTFSSPGVPATCTYSYTASGWEDEFGNPISAPSGTSASESVCILADNSQNLSGQYNGTLYVAPGVTFSGNLPNFSEGTIINEGTISYSNFPTLYRVSIYNHTTGVWNAAGDFTIEDVSFLYNAGDINVGGDVALGGGSLNYNYPDATFIAQGNFNVNSPFYNCGLLEIVTGQLTAGGGSGLHNLCTTYVHNIFKLNNNYTNEGLLIVDGTLDFNGKNLTNDDTIIANNIILNSSNLIGNYYSSILIVRNDAQLLGDTEPASITGHYYFDIDDGGGFDFICGICTEDIIILDNAVVPSDPAQLRADCGINIVIDFPFCQTIEGDNTIYGKVFNDFDRNGTLDPGEPIEGGVTVNLYSDLNSNGIIDGADSIIQTTVSNVNGEYSLGVTPIVTLNQVFSKRVDRSSDDADQDDKSSVKIGNSKYSFALESPFTGIRINDISIPRGSQINSATISFFSKDDETGLLSYEISGQKIDNAQTFTEIENNISNRWATSNRVPWFNIPDWSADTVYTTPDMSSIVQNIVNRFGWTTNNSMAFIFKYFLGADSQRTVVSYDGDVTTAPLLEINYDSAEPASYIVQIDASTLPGGYNLTTPNTYAIPFTWVNEISCDNDFGFAAPCNDPSGTDTDSDGVNDGCDLDDDNDGILDVDECADLGKDRILNSDFEYVNIVTSGLDQGPTDTSVIYTGIWKGDDSYTPNWESVHLGNIFEIWQNGHTLADDAGGTAYSGIQWAEVNISTNDGFYQDITTTPGDLLQWSFAHRKRLVYSGSGTEDVVRLLIGDPVGPLVSEGDFSSANNSTWTLHTGTYTVPVGQTTTRLQFTAISTVSGSLVAGNFVDAVQFYVIPNCENTDGDVYGDYHDIDSDDDGIPDNIEAQATIGYVPPIGVVNTNGLYPNYASGLTLIDTDSDGIYDFRDPDADADGTPDIEENGMADIAGPSDTDADGLNDIFETNGVSDVTWDVNEDIENPLANLPDADNDGLVGGDVDYRDLLDTTSPEFARVDFDGDNDFMQITDSPINYTDEFTLSFWMKLEETLTGGINDKTFVIGQKDMFEISIGNNIAGLGNPHIWATHFYGAGPSQLISDGHPINNVNWIHITARVSYITEIVDLYVNGEQVTTLDISGNSRLINLNPFRIGSKRDIQPDPDQENFHGWMDEIRIFSSLLTTSQIQRMVYQEIEDNAGVTHGVIIDKDIIDITSSETIPWYNLVCYLPMNEIKSSKVKDESSYGNDGELFNIFTIEPQDVPMPYVTKSVGDGAWTTEGTWLSGDVWDIEDIDNNKDWSIVHIKANVTTTRSHTQLGMLIDAGGTLTVNGDNEINNNWYLQLDGTMDLADDSQLIQTENSDLVTSATGKIIRRQEGNTDVFWYNYWSSPVGSLGATTLTDNNGTSNNLNNTPFSINMLKDDLGAPIQFTAAFQEVGKLSTRWLYSFQNGLTYYDWNLLGSGSTIQPGVGYIHKGTGNAGTEQQYIFEGKPNNGTILIPADDVDNDHLGVGESVKDVTLTTSLIGNPYPSALDALQFITDNSSVISGTLQLWEQWAGGSHNLAEYEGGYGYINILTTERAYQDPEIPIADQVQTQGIKRPTNYIPVGQGFIVEVIEDGNIEFNNGQRVFIKESDVMGDQEHADYANNGSSFFRTSNTDNTQSSTEETAAETQILRLEFGVSSGASRSFVLGFTEDATDGSDYGLDGGLINNPPADDMGSLLNGQQYVIQAFAPITPDKEIDLVLHASGNYTYTLRSTEISNFPVDQDLFLKDLLTGQHYDLRSTEPYNFTSVAGSFTGRFQVVFQDPAALSTEEFTPDNTLIYVNQAEDKLYVKQLANRAKELFISNMLGQRIKTFKAINNQTLENGLNISNLSPGVYVVSIKTVNDQSIDKKVIIN